MFLERMSLFSQLIQEMFWSTEKPSSMFHTHFSSFSFFALVLMPSADSPFVD